MLLFQNPNFWVPPALISPPSSHLARDLGILIPVSSFCLHCQTACPGTQLCILAPCTLNMSPKHLNLVFNSPSFHCQGPSQIPGNLTPAVLVNLGLEFIHVCIYIILVLSSCLQDMRSSERTQGCSPSPPVYPLYSQKEPGERSLSFLQEYEQMEQVVVMSSLRMVLI